jgi:hypothetical protein
LSALIEVWDTETFDPAAVKKRMLEMSIDPSGL